MSNNLIEKGEGLLKLGEYSKARTAFEEAVEECPGDWRSYAGFMTARAFGGSYIEALLFDMDCGQEYYPKALKVAETEADCTEFKKRFSRLVSGGAKKYKIEKGSDLYTPEDCVRALKEEQKRQKAERDGMGVSFAELIPKKLKLKAESAFFPRLKTKCLNVVLRIPNSLEALIINQKKVYRPRILAHIKGESGAFLLKHIRFGEDCAAMLEAGLEDCKRLETLDLFSCHDNCFEIGCNLLTVPSLKRVYLPALSAESSIGHDAENAFERGAGWFTGKVSEDLKIYVSFDSFADYYAIDAFSGIGEHIYPIL